MRRADAAPRPAPAGRLALLVLVAAWLSVLAGRRAVPSLAALAGGSDLLKEVAANLVVCSLLWGAAALGLGWEGRTAWRTGGGGRARSALLGAGLGGGGYLLAVILVAASGHLALGAQGGGAQALGGLLLALALAALQAAAEETAFRGWLQPVLCARWGVWVGLLATSLLFAAAHLAAGARSPMALLNLTLAGLVFGLLALRSGGLLAPVAAHLSWNGMEAGVLGLTPNPGVGPTGAPFDLDMVGGGLWGGGADAMNGSLAATLVLLGGVLLLARSPRAAPSSVS